MANRSWIPAAILVVACVAPAQPVPSFEVASVKPDPLAIRSDPTQNLRDDLTCDVGGRFVARRNNPMRLIRKAYGVQGFEVEGMPGWARNADAFYDVEASAGRTVTAAECQLMLQSLLAERFKLTVHKQPKDISVLVLTVGKNGPKMTAGEEGGPGARINGRPQPIAPDGTRTPTGWTMAQLADALTLPSERISGLPVLDRTGLTGAFQFDLRYNEFPGIGTKLSDLPDFDVAVEEQLGLKVEERKEPFQVIVIDHIEKPSAN